MDKNLTYQQARRLRHTSLGKIFADQLEQNTVGGAIKRAVSLKVQSKVKGIQEKFDPLNIAKFMTFGSSWAPALLGKLTGRSHDDTRYFSGRLKPIIVKQKSSKVTPLPKDGEQLVEGENVRVKGINEQLVKIYKLLKKAQDADKRRREMEHNFDEERADEAEARHQKLLKALSGLSIGGTSTLVEGEKPKGILENLADTLFGGIWTQLLTKVPLLGWFAAFVTVPALAGYLFSKYWKGEQEQQSAENIQDATNRGGDVAGQAAAELERMRQTGEDQDPMNDDKVKLLMGQRDDGIKRRDYFREEFLRSSGYRKTTSFFSKVPVYKDSAKKEPPDDMMKAANQFAEEQTQKIFTGEVKDPLGKFVYKSATPTKTENKSSGAAPTPTTPASTAGGGRGGQGGPTAEQAAQNTGLTAAPVPSPTAEVVPSAPELTQKLGSAMAENVDANLPKEKADENITVNNVTQSTKAPDVKPELLTTISVRNPEPILRSHVVEQYLVIA